MKNNSYFLKMKGQEKRPLRKLYFSEMLISCLGCFFVIMLISVIDKFSHEIFTNQPLFVAPVGASAVMIFGIPTSSYAQPRNVIGGHFFSALCGVFAYSLFPDTVIFTGALAVCLAMGVMYATQTVHPPGGATALLAIIGDEQITSLGVSYAFVPCLSNGIILVLCGILINNLSKKRSYPRFW